MQSQLQVQYIWQGMDPFGKYIQMTKKMIELLINGYEYNENERKSKDDENN